MSTVAVTGAAGYIGRRLLQLLDGDEEVRRVVAVDLRDPGTGSAKVDFVRHDVSEPMAHIFTNYGVTRAVHLAFLVDPVHDRARERRVNVGGTESFLTACDAAGVDIAVLASSATAYGAWPDNPPRLTEDAPLRGKPGFPYVEDKIELERLAAAYADEHTRCRVIRIRPTVVAGPHMDNYLSRFLLKPVSFTFRGVDPAIPMVHEDDVAEAIRVLLREGPTGAYNLDAPDPVPLSEAIRRLGAHTLRLPPWLLRVLSGVAWRLRFAALSEVPPAMTDFIRWPWVCDGTKITRETGFRYTFTAHQALAAFLEARGAEEDR